MPTYEERERQDYYRKLHEIEHAPLHERREAAGEFRAMLAQRPDIIAERIGWILNGSYGYGACYQAYLTIKNPRVNQRSILCQMVAALEWMCPANYAIKVWKSLTEEQQTTLNELIDDEIKDALAEPTIEVPA